MDDQHAEQIMQTARRLRSETARRFGATVRVSFRGFDHRHSEIGRASVEVTADTVRLSELEHTQCASGLAWSRSIARRLEHLDAVRRRPPVPSPPPTWIN